MKTAEWNGKKVCNGYAFYKFFSKAYGTDFVRAMRQAQNAPDQTDLPKLIACLYGSMRRTTGDADVKDKDTEEIAYSELDAKDSLDTSLMSFLVELATGKKLTWATDQSATSPTPTLQ